MRKLISLFLAWTLLIGIFAGCVSEDGGQRDTITVTDLLGREVSVPGEVSRVVCIGAGALRLYCYVGDMAKLCGVEECEKGFLISVRPYQTLHEELFRSLVSIGSGGPKGAPDAEAILSARPDVIFSLYTSDVSAMDELQAKTGIPVVVLSYGKTEAFDESLLQSLTLMGKVLGRVERAKQVTDTIHSIADDLDTRTKDIPDNQKKTVYLGCQSNYGTHGIGSTTAEYSLFDAVHARNVLDLAGYHGYQKALDMETLVTLDPEVMFLDAGGLSVLAEEYRKNGSVFENMRAFRNGEVYLTMPYNAYYTNLEIAYVNAYFIGKTLYPEAFADVEIGAKAEEISTALLGQNVFSFVTAAIPNGYERLDVSLFR